MTNLKNISDNDLFIRSKKYGKDVLRARQLFAGLLPEVYKRRLYEKKKFSSIYEFAAKLAGFSHEQVDAVIRLERKFEDKPALHAALVEGKISANKLIRIASIATAENQGELFEAAKKLSKTAIDVYVKDYRYSQSEADRNGERAQCGLQHLTAELDNKVAGRNGLLTGENGPKSLPGQSTWLESSGVPKGTDVKTANIDFEIIAALTPELKIKIKVLIDKGINVSELFTELLEKREQSIEQSKQEIAQEIEQKSGQKSYIFESGRPSATLQQKPVTRHIPANVKKIIKQEFGKKCAHSNCNNAAENLHHQKQFAIFRTHDPRFIKPLCKGHHELEHVEDQAYTHYKYASVG